MMAGCWGVGACSVFMSGMDGKVGASLAAVGTSGSGACGGVGESVAHVSTTACVAGSCGSSACDVLLGDGRERVELGEEAGLSPGGPACTFGDVGDGRERVDRGEDFLAGRSVTEDAPEAPRTAEKGEALCRSLTARRIVTDFLGGSLFGLEDDAPCRFDVAFSFPDTDVARGDREMGFCKGPMPLVRSPLDVFGLAVVVFVGERTRVADVLVGACGDAWVILLLFAPSFLGLDGSAFRCADDAVALS